MIRLATLARRIAHVIGSAHAAQHAAPYTVRSARIVHYHTTGGSIHADK